MHLIHQYPDIGISISAIQYSKGNHCCVNLLGIFTSIRLESGTSKMAITDVLTDVHWKLQRLAMVLTSGGAAQSI